MTNVETFPINAAITYMFGHDASNDGGRKAIADFVQLTGFQTVTGLKTVTLGTATTFATYALWLPSDFGPGKPSIGLNKQATANAWSFGLYDTLGNSGTIEFNCGGLLWNGSQIVTRSATETFTGQKTFSGNITTFNGPAAGLEIGRVDGVAGTPILDFHSGATAVDYDSRILATGGTGVAGSGDFLIYSASLFAAGVYSTTTANAANVNVASNGQLLRSTSSEQYKTDIEPMDVSAFEALMKLKPIWYRSKCENDNPEHSFYGFSAEAVAKIDPRWVHWRTTKPETYIEKIEYEEDEQIVIPNDDPEIPPTYEVRKVKRVKERSMIRNVPLKKPVAEGVAYDRMVVGVIGLLQSMNARLEALEAKK